MVVLLYACISSYCTVVLNHCRAAVRLCVVHLTYVATLYRDCTVALEVTVQLCWYIVELLYACISSYCTIVLNHCRVAVRLYQ